ncbi:MAG: hypothetical protein ACOYD0_03930 [Candidatus Nanopelagicales bacterium]
MSTPQAILILGGIPAAVVLIAVLGVMAPGWTRAGRYRPGEPWNHESLVINAAASGDISKALTMNPRGLTSEVRPADVPKEGGASARW